MMTVMMIQPPTTAYQCTCCPCACGCRAEEEDHTTTMIAIETETYPKRITIRRIRIDRGDNSIVNSSNKIMKKKRTISRMMSRSMRIPPITMMMTIITVFLLFSSTIVSGRLAATPTHRRLSTEVLSPGGASLSDPGPTRTSNTRLRTSTASTEASEGGDGTTGVVISSRPIGSFHPLDCNKDLDKEPCSMTSWESKFGPDLIFEDTVIIPCGSCIVLSAASLQKASRPIEFRRGLIVEGKLVLLGDEGMKPQTTLQILTKHIVVYGSLIMESTKEIVDGYPSISIEFIDDGGANDEKKDILIDRSFRPPYQEDSIVCGESPTGRCDMGGHNAFIVAGGQIDIRGIPNLSMPTWVPLIDVRDSSSTSTTSSSANQLIGGGADGDSDTEPNDDGYLGYDPPPTNCNEDGILISHDFLSSTTSQSIDAIDMYFRPSYGSRYEMTNRGTMKFVNREHPQHCPVIDLQRIRHCLRPDQVYLLTARLVLYDNTHDSSDEYSWRSSSNNSNDMDRRTECSRTGENCLSIYQAWTNPRGMGHTSNQWKETLHFGTRFGEEITIDIPFNFTQRVLSEENIFEILQLRGPGAGIDMELISFDLRAPPKESYPRRDDTCGGNLIRNGDAQMNGLNTYPFTKNNPEVHLSIRTERNGNYNDNWNHYFAVTGRAASVAKAPDRRKGKKWKSAGISYTVIPETCIRKGYYSFQADVRMYSSDRAAEARWLIKGIFDDKNRIPVSETLATCPPSTGGWLNCNGGIEMSDRLQGFSQYEIVLEMDSDESDGVDYDVDNVSFQFEMSRGFDQLILPKSIQGGWSVGAEIIVASQQQHFDDPENYIRRIVQIEDHDEEGQVCVSLNTPLDQLDQPLVGDSSNNAEMKAHVALLSRNILLKANNGGHLSVLNTPGVAQTLQGVEIVGFGQENQIEPIRFGSCQGGTSLISKNSIRQSNNGCILLNATSDVLVESNVGFDVMGSSCFVAEGGSENNIFNNNVGVPVVRTQVLDLNGEESVAADVDVPPVFVTDSKSNTWSGNIAIRNVDGEGTGNNPVVQINEHGSTSNPLAVFNMQKSSELDEI